MYKSNAAFNISRQAENQVQYTPKIRVIESKKKDVAPSVLTRFELFKMFMALACVVSIVVVMINFRVKLTELTGEISNQMTVLSALEIEQEGIISELNAADKLSHIENYAKDNLGMSKLESYQVRYITPETNDIISIGGGEPTFVDKVKNFINDFVAYIKD
ncbi:MAG: cell division protein FtsL [Oscillospiraceae bacterium]